MTTHDAIRIERVRFAYRPGTPVLTIDNLRVEAGRKVFLHGPSGSGKTTLLSLISGVLVPQKGSVTVLGQDLTRLSASGRDTLRGSQIGYIFQGFNLIPYLSVAENIALPCNVHSVRRSRIRASTLSEEVARLAHRLDIDPYLHTPVTRLSTGQQQRVAIARAIIGSPALIVADEPTSSLDVDRRNSFLELLMEIMEETKVHGGVAATLLFVSHDRSLAVHFDETLSLAELNQDAASTGATDR